MEKLNIGLSTSPAARDDGPTLVPIPDMKLSQHRLAKLMSANYGGAERLALNQAFEAAL
jgi:hypothetical protein